MTTLLEKAIHKISVLPEPQQDELASFILAEMESESSWKSLFASSQDMLSGMADDALAEYRTGKTEPLDLNRDFPQD